MRRFTGLAFPIGIMAALAIPVTASAQEDAATEEVAEDEAPMEEAVADEEAETETEEMAEEEPAPEPMMEEEAAPEPMMEEEEEVETSTVPAPAPLPADAEAAADDAEPSVTPLDEEEVERFVVTGTRIKRKEDASAAPVTVLTRDELLATGLSSVGEILQRLPANAGAINVQFNNGGNGTARIDLRNLGTARTLVLLNGRRHVPGGDGVDVSVDLNSIPLTIIERVEVLKDGASAVYGSDAIAGVVNIITRKDFYGVEVGAYSGLSQRGDGNVYQIDLTTGISSEKGNLVASVTFFDQQPVFAGEREFSELARDFDWEAWDADGRPSGIDRSSEDYVFASGSSATPQGTIVDRSGAIGNAAWDGSGCRGGLCYNDPNSGWRPFVDPDDLYNFQPENYLVTPNRRFNFFTQGNYEIHENVEAFFELSYTDRRSAQLLAPNPLFTIVEGVSVSGENVYNPFGRDFTDVRRRLLEVNNRVFRQNSSTSRIVVGFQGNLPDLGGMLEEWSYDVYGNFGRTNTVNVLEGQLDLTRLQSALGPDSGCTGECVPFNIFGGAGSITQEMIDYLSVTAVDRGFNDQRIYAFNVGGPLFEIVEGNPVGLAFGYQYRREAGADIPNAQTAQGTLSGNKREAVKGKFDVNAFYAELVAPLVEGLPGVEAFEFNAAARFVDFSTFGSDVAFKVGLRWQITDWLAARGTYSTAYRAPAVAELFSGVLDSFPSVEDPCSAIVGDLSNPTVQQNCEADGAAGNLDNRTQLLAQEGGNTELQPETATIITAGLVLEDNLVPGLSANLDYYTISVEDSITAISSSVILASCYESDPSARQFCELIQRDGDGFITQINDTLQNVGGTDAAGIDWEIRYVKQSPIGRFGLNFDGTYYLDFTQTLATGFEYDALGVYDFDENSQLQWRARSNLAWMYDMYNVGVNLRFFPGFDECDNAACNAERQAGSEPPIRRTTDSYFAADLFAGVSLDWTDSGMGQTALTVGVNNLTDATPPFIVNGFLAESDAATYDYLGRYFYFRLTQRF